MKNLITEDLMLRHFTPLDSKKAGGSVLVSNAVTMRSGNVDGSVKDDIWHECCRCCP